MPNFLEFTDEMIFDFLAEHFQDFDVGELFLADMTKVKRTLLNKNVSIERHQSIFAIVLLERVIPELNLFIESKILFLYASQGVRGTGVDKSFVEALKVKFMKKQDMIIECCAERSKAFFEQCNFVVVNDLKPGFKMRCHIGN